jgi:tetratricopeptide (TPR) repeat protein
MKKLMFLMLACLSFTLVQAQTVKDAKKALNSFNLNPKQDSTALLEAYNAIEAAMQKADNKNDVDAHLIKGEVYTEIANQLNVVRTTNIKQAVLPDVDQPGVVAARAFLKAYELAEKRGDKKDAVKGLQTLQTILSSLGVYELRNQLYPASYANFMASLDVHSKLKELGEDSVLDAEEQLVLDQQYYGGLAAILMENYAAAKPLFVTLVEAEYDDPGVYDAMYKIIAAEDSPQAAYTYLEQGREKFPDDVALLFTEINYYLATNELDVLIDKLEQAIEAEPKNVSLYATMGNVYDNLYQRAAEEGNDAKAQEYFDKALDYYNQAIEVDPNFADAYYSMGALYYNRAAVKTQQLTALADDFSKEGQKKYEALKAEVDKEFAAALPHFKEAEKRNPGELNTLIALKEIYARQNDFETSNVFKDRLERVQAGEEITESYFKNN